MKTGILGYGHFTPERIVTNQDLEKMVDTSDQWIVERTGIRTRHYASKEDTASSLGVQAALQAMQRAGIKAEELDLIMVATVTPDMLFPSTAALIQAKLGAKHAAAFDLEAACSGFLYGLHLADALIQGGKHEKILLIGVELLTKITDFSDRNTCVLFGDGAGAVVLGKTDKGGILSTLIGADGEGAKFLYQTAGGSLKPACMESVQQGEHFIRMDGREVYKFAVRKMQSASLEVIEKANLQQCDIDYFVPHQANIRIIEAAAKRLNLTMDKVKVNLDRFGNMSSASIPVALSEALSLGEIQEGDNVLLVAFGGGLTWGASIIQFGGKA